MTAVRELSPESIVLTLESPAFALRPPDLRNGDLMPPDMAAMMTALWNSGSFAASQIRFALLRDVFVVKEGLVFDSEGQLFACSITQHDDADIAEGREWIRLHGARAERHAGICVLCKKRGVVNYGHWMIEMLPKMFLASRHLDLAGLRYVVPAGGAAMTRVVANTADRLGIGAGQRIVLDHAPAFFAELVVVDGLTSHGGFMSPLVMDCMDALGAQVGAGGARKLLVTRASHRGLANQAEVMRAAAASGYVAVDPGRMSLAQQIACFKGARDIVGIMGAAMTNIAFAARGARVVNLAPAAMPDTFYWFIAGLRGLDYGEIRCRQTGPVRGHAPWDTDIAVDPADLAHLFRNDGARPPRCNAMKDIESVATPWREVVLVCAKCTRKLDGGFGKKQKHPLRSTLKDALREQGRRREIRIAETGCLGLCPKNAVSLLRGGRPELLLAIPAGTGMDEVLQRLDFTPG